MANRVGFIGLGIMGQPMARNLLRAGFPVTVWNRSRSGIDALVAEGAAEAANPREAARSSDIVITMVGDSPDVEQVALGADGIIEGARLATTYRRVQHLDARFGETGGDAACDIGRDGGHVGVDEAGVRAFDDAVGAECDLLDVR